MLSRAYQPGNKKFFLIFLAACLLVLSPLLLAAYQDSFGFYVTHRWLSNGNSEWNLFESPYYLTTLFWESWKGSFGYAPRWGGLLNPVLGAFFFLGLGEAWRLRRGPLAQALGGSFLLFLIPVLFTDNYSATRLTPLLVPCLILTAWGIQIFALSCGNFLRKAYIPILLLLSICLDGINLVQTRAYTNSLQEGPKYTRSIQAWDKLSQLSLKGPGAVFLNFINDPRDRSLALLTYSFNPLVNDQIAPESIRWAAVLADEEYRPCLDKSFSGIQWQRLAWDSRDLKGGICFVRGVYLGVIPLSKENRPVILRWIPAGKDLENFTLDDLNYVPPRSHDPILEKMDGFYGDFKKNNFLKTFFWEKEAHDYAEDKNYLPALRALDDSLRAGCLRGYLFQEQGQLLVKTKSFDEAKRAFIQAGRLDSRLIPPKPLLELLEGLKKSQRTVP